VFTSHTTHSCPPRIRRLTMFAPIRPKPIIPSCILCPLRCNLKVDVMKQAPPTASGKLAASGLDMRLKGGAMETIYIGVDFHARQQTICYLTTETGEFVTHELKHQYKDEVRTFYAQFGGRVIVGLEASGYSPWFEQLLEDLGHEVWLGDATEIRR